MRRQSLSQVACSKDMFRKESSFSRLSLPWACWRQRTGTEMAFLTRSGQCPSFVTRQSQVR